MLSINISTKHIFMSDITSFYSFTFLRNITPIVPFLTPYLIQNKKIANKDVHNKLIPWFFISSLLLALSGSFLVRAVGNKMCILIDTVCDLALNVIFLMMPNESIVFGALGCFLHGVSTSLASISKCIVYEIEPEKQKRNYIISNYNLIKKLCSLGAAWFAQDMYFSCGTNKPSLYTTMMFLVGSLVSGMFIPENKGVQKVRDNIFVSFYNNGVFNTLGEIYYPKVLFFSLIQIIGSSLYISFSIYSSNVFIERRKNIDVSSGMLGKIFYNITMPFRLLSFVFVKVFSLFDKEITYSPKYEKNTLIFGYIDGLAKAISLVITYFLVAKNYSLFTLITINISLVIFLIITKFFLGKVSSLTNSYICFVLGSTAANTLLQIAHTGINKEKKIEELVSFNLVIASIIHISISYIARWKEATAQKKMYYYVGTSMILFALSLCSLAFVKF
ncbi:hypothetical protein SLOPH_1825 [Spraguea lophii 42_110]|uniref:Uncharacterized protein n=1 Tax=Spraguea lophii (strain 42_110) TaxID=1358809 RepID=S7XU81_SPRLO|nr:hypothetical protein SLOPH_1825 [Spraguea lophii 42_110]